MSNTKTNPNDFVTLHYFHENGDPITAINGSTKETIHPRALTKRECFAAMAMQGLASNPDWAKTMRTPDDWDEYKERLASGAVELADALIEALNQNTEGQ